MAVDYTDLFTRIGKLIQVSNSFKTLATTTYPANLKEIADEFEIEDRTDQIEGLYSFFAGLQEGITANRQELRQYVENVLTDRTTVLDEIPGLIADDVQTVLPAFARQMSTDSASIAACTVTIGTVTAAAGNVGNGTFLLTKVLDGFNAPVQNGQAYLGYNGLDSQLGVNETMTFTCEQDSDRDGTAIGAEVFSWVGGVPSQQLDYLDEGSGQGPSITVANSGFSLIQNGDFEDFTTANTPDSWTIDTGTAGTHIFSDTANEYRGTNCLKFTGNGSLAAIQISQSVSPQLIRPRRMYCVSARIKADATIAAGTLGIEFNGTGYTPASSERISIAPGSLPTSYTLYHFFVSIPSQIPDDWELVIKWTGTPTNAKSVWIDALAVAEVVYHGGVGAVAVAGSTQFVAGDRFTVAITNNNSGVIQRYFREAFAFQLPTSGSPTIADSLAT